MRKGDRKLVFLVHTPSPEIGIEPDFDLPLPTAASSSMSRAPGSSLPPWTLDCTTFFFCCSLTLGVKVVALANRRKSIAWRLLLFRPFFQKPVQYVQLLTVRPHLYMNAAAPLYQ